MTTKTDIVNRALAAIGTRTNVTDAELAASSTNEAIQANLIYAPFRNQLLRMAPWNCAFQTKNLTYITSSPGTPENTSNFTQLWQKGQPAPPWAYEYQYPVDCLRACWITPQTATGFAGGVPITTAVTGGAPSYWQGPPVRFKVAVDQFFSGTDPVAVVNGGSGYAPFDFITIALAPNTSIITNRLGTFQIGQPQGAPIQLTVVAVSGSGAITQVAVINQILNTTEAFGGSYFYDYGGAVLTQGSTTGSGSGATFTSNISNTVVRDQRVILTNQEFAILNYVKVITDENVFDDDFQEAFINCLAVGLTLPLSGDKGLANLALGKCNQKIIAARGTDGNEGLTINDVVPDWIRIRGIDYTSGYSGPFSSGNDGYNWGGLWSGFS